MTKVSKVPWFILLVEHKSPGPGAAGNKTKSPSVFIFPTFEASVAWLKTPDGQKVIRSASRTTMYEGGWVDGLEAQNGVYVDDSLTAVHRP